MELAIVTWIIRKNSNKNHNIMMIMTMKKFKMKF